MSNQPLPGKLILVRHHESTLNQKGVWTGRTDVPLDVYGREKSEEMGKLIRDQHIDQAIISPLIRTSETLKEMEKGMGESNIPISVSPEITERDYGDYTGKNKWEIKDLVGEEEWKEIRRGWNHPVPNGETLKMVYERSVPFYLGTILPMLEREQTVLVVAHGNSLRSILKYIKNISDSEIGDFEFSFGTIMIIKVDEAGHLLNEEIRKVESHVNA